MKFFKSDWLLVGLTAIVGCHAKEKLFHLVPPTQSGIHFNNSIIENDSLNVIDVTNIYNGGGVGIGLVVAFAAWPRRLPSALSTREGEQAFGHFLKIGTDGRVTVAVPQVETGQGIWTALPQILADELGAA